jgi:hypothetical protein
VLLVLGAAVPIAYVALSGGPEHASGRGPPVDRPAPSP